MDLSFSPDVLDALEKKKPLLALESTIITHGFEKPHNLDLARDLENTVRELGVTPATIAVIDGKAKIGLEDKDLEALAEKGQAAGKFSSYDLPVAMGLGLTGSCTVAGTSFLAHKAGLRVFSTGGIGGVHPEAQSRMDISHDLNCLGKTPLVVISSGAKCILDLDSTFEQLETQGVPVLGWKTNEFPAFYYNQSGLKLNYTAQSLEQVAAIEKQERSSALLLVNPIPKEFELDKTFVNALMKEAEEEAEKNHVSGKNRTPYMLSYLHRKSEGRTQKSNWALIKSNVELGALLAHEIYR